MSKQQQQALQAYINTPAQPAWAKNASPVVTPKGVKPPKDITQAPAGVQAKAMGLSGAATKVAQTASGTAVAGGQGIVQIADSRGIMREKPYRGGTTAQQASANNFFTGLNETIDEENGLAPDEMDVTPGPHSNFGKAITALGKDVENASDKVGDFAENLPTPGGIFVLLILLALFMWAVIPVNNGMTRAQLLYYVLTQKAALLPATMPPGTGGLLSQSAVGGIQTLSFGANSTSTSTGASNSQTTGQQTIVPLNLNPSPNVGSIPDFSL